MRHNSSDNYSESIVRYSDQFNLAGAFSGIFFTLLNLIYAAFTYKAEDPNFLDNKTIQRAVDIIAVFFSTISLLSMVVIIGIKRNRAYQSRINAERNQLAEIFAILAPDNNPPINPFALTRYEETVYTISNIGLLGFFNILRFDTSFLEKISATSTMRLGYLLISCIGISCTLLLEVIQSRLTQPSDLIKVIVESPAESGPVVGVAFTIFLVQNIVFSDLKIKPIEASFLGYFILSFALLKATLNYIALKKINSTLSIVKKIGQKPLPQQSTLLEKCLWFGFLCMHILSETIKPLGNFLTPFNIFTLTTFSNSNMKIHLFLQIMFGITGTVGVAVGLHNGVWCAMQATRNVERRNDNEIPMVGVLALP